MESRGSEESSKALADDLIEARLDRLAERIKSLPDDRRALLIQEVLDEDVENECQTENEKE